MAGIRNRSAPSHGIEDDVVHVDVLHLAAVEGERLIEREFDTADLAPVRQDHVVIAVAPHAVGIDGANARRKTIITEQYDPFGIVGPVGDD